MSTQAGQAPLQFAHQKQSPYNYYFSFLLEGVQGSVGPDSKVRTDARMPEVSN